MDRLTDELDQLRVRYDNEMHLMKQSHGNHVGDIEKQHQLKALELQHAIQGHESDIASLKQQHTLSLESKTQQHAEAL